MAQHANMITLTPSVARQRSCCSLMLPPLRPNPVRHIKGLTRLHLFAPNNNFKTEMLQVPRVQNDGRWPILSADTRHHFLMFIVDLAPRPSPRQARNTRGLALVDFTLPIDPMVPATRVFCANEVESRAPAETVIQATGCVGV